MAPARTPQSGGFNPRKPIALVPGESERFIYWYELLKRPGWKNRFVQDREYVGGGRNRYRMSIDVKARELKRRCDTLEDAAAEAPEGSAVAFAVDDCASYIPFFTMGKRSSFSNFSAKNGAGASINLLPSIQVNAMIHDALIGCILKYQKMQKLYRAAESDVREQVDELYPGMFPILAITLPSPKMMQVFALYIEGNTVYRNADDLFDDIDKTFERPEFAMTFDERASWWAIRRVYEFRQLMLRFTNERLFVLRAEPLKNQADTILSVEFTTTLDEGTASDAPRAAKALAKVLLSLAFALAMLYLIPPDVGAGPQGEGAGPQGAGPQGAGAGPLDIASLPIVADALSIVGGLPAGTSSLLAQIAFTTLMFLLFYAFLSEDYLVGAKRFFGVTYQMPLDVIGMAESEHMAFKAPPGIVFSPYGLQRPTMRRFAFKKSRVSIIDQLASGSHKAGDVLGSDECQAEARCALTPDAALVQSNKSWNDHDPLVSARRF